MKTDLFACDGQILTGAAEGDNVHGFDFRPVDVGYVTEVFHVRETVGRYTDWEVFDFRSPYRLDTIQGTGKRESTRTIEQRS